MDETIQDVFDHLLYLPLELENPPLDCLDYLNSLDFSSLYPDSYRNCYHVPLRFDVKRREFEWMKWAENMPTLVEWVQDVLFKVTGDSRVMIITTPDDYKNPLHIDCSKKDFHQPQHKIRYVLQGNVSDLTFYEGMGNKVSPVELDKSFVMSGKWPHSMHNRSGGTKFTLALGSPWDGSLGDEKYVDLLTRSYGKWKDWFVSSESFRMYEQWESLFEESSDHRKNVRLLEKRVGG